MIDPGQIPYLVKLLDDDSLEIQGKVIKELSSFGPLLSEELDKISFELNSVQRQHIDSILEVHKRIWLRRVWPTWFNLAIENHKLEKALDLLSQFLSEGNWKIKLDVLLDNLAVEYKERHTKNDSELLAQFLFREKGLKGNTHDYYNPQNSNLIFVIREKKGIPISLASVYILVGHRLGLTIEGCHFPGHFLARIHRGGRKAFVDCFNEGQIIPEEDMRQVKRHLGDNIENILFEQVQAASIVRRYLSNLIRAFQVKSNLIVEDMGEDADDSEFVQEFPFKVENESHENSRLMIDLMNSLDRLWAGKD